MSAVGDVVVERARQVYRKGWTYKHDDDEHINNELALAAASLACQSYLPGHAEQLWPWDGIKDKGHRQNCVRAAALLIAEIERLDRASQRDQEVKP